MAQFQACHQRVQLVAGQDAVIQGIGGLQLAPVGVFGVGVEPGLHDGILHGDLGILRLGQISSGLLVVLDARDQQKPHKQHDKGEHRHDIQ